MHSFTSGLVIGIPASRAVIAIAPATSAIADRLM
jgi:hypothetical protein